MTSPSSTCPECGKLLTGDHPVCPACLMRQALASRTIVPGENPSIVQPPSPEEIADKFPQFEILECLGRGGMGVVYKARQKSLNRIVAIKILAPERETEARFAERFAREAELLAKLNHPHIVTIHDFGETGGLFYLVMEFVDGVNLRDLLRDGKLEAKQALAIVPPICEALQYAHDKGIVHRDIKPENLLLDRDGRIKIADFGIAGLVGAGGENAGTPPYMAPEQTGISPEVDHRADIYALGVVLYEMLTGERPGKEVVAPSRKVQIDVRLDEMVLRALEKEPQRRYQTAGEFRTVLETVAGSPLPETTPSSGLLKTERGRMAVQETSATPIQNPASGELALHGDRLVICSANTRREVALRDIRGLAEVVMPWWYSPAGHRFAAVDFDENGERKRLVFMAGESAFRLVETTRLRASEWLFAIQQAARAATGNELAISPLLSVMPLKSMPLLPWLLPSALAAIVLGGFLKTPVSGSVPHFVDLLVFLPFLVLLIPLVILAMRNREFAKPGPRGPVVFTVAAVGLLLSLAATGNAAAMMVGAAFVLMMGLIGFAKGNIRLALLVTMAALGVAGSAVMLLKRNQTRPTRTGTVAMGGEMRITLPDPAAGSPCVLDFETGKLLEPPAEVFPSLNNDVSQLPPAALRWLRDNGADAVVEPDGSVRLIEGVVFSPTRQGKALMWDDFTPDQVVSTVAAMSDEQRRATATQPAFHFVTSRQPDAVAFTTRERSCGVLQILGATVQPHGLRIRYKLVRNPLTSPPLPAGTISSTAGTTGRPNENLVSDPAVSSARQSIEAAKVINDTNRFLDLELAVIDAKAGGMGDKHPSVIVAADVLARFKETHPDTPDAVWRQLVGQRLDQAKNDLAVLSAGGLGKMHPAVAAQQARIRALEEMLGTSEAEPSQLVNPKPIPAPADGSNVITLSAQGDITVAGVACPPDQLAARLSELAAKHFEAVSIRADAAAPIVRVVALTEACKAAGIEKTAMISAVQTPQAASVVSGDQIAVQDLALHLIVAVREKDDEKLRAIATDRIKGWRDALPAFAVELREHFRQLTGSESFDLRAGECLIDGDLAAVRCTGPAELKGNCLVLFFTKTATDGWRNLSLRNSTEGTPLAETLANLKQGLEKQQAVPKPAGK